MIKILLALFWTFFAIAESDFFKGKTSLENPFDLRDPFEPAKQDYQIKSELSTKVAPGVYSNIPTLGRVNIKDIKVIGVLIGKERRAMLQTVGQSTGQTYVVKEGQLLGDEKAEIKAILPSGLVLVEKITNVYGEQEYLETVIPISK
jgi:type IV pilus assembly protein PilP